MTMSRRTVARIEMSFPSLLNRFYTRSAAAMVSEALMRGHGSLTFETDQLRGTEFNLRITVHQVGLRPRAIIARQIGPEPYIELERFGLNGLMIGNDCKVLVSVGTGRRRRGSWIRQLLHRKRRPRCSVRRSVIVAARQRFVSLGDGHSATIRL
jgi:hypothetical protein